MTGEATGQRCINCKAPQSRIGNVLVIIHIKGCPEYRKGQPS